MAWKVYSRVYYRGKATGKPFVSFVGATKAETLKRARGWVKSLGVRKGYSFKVVGIKKYLPKLKKNSDRRRK